MPSKSFDTPDAFDPSYRFASVGEPPSPQRRLSASIAKGKREKCLAAAPAMSWVDAGTGGSLVAPPSFDGGSRYKLKDRLLRNKTAFRQGKNLRLRFWFTKDWRNEARSPAGSPEGGRWTGSGESSTSPKQRGGSPPRPNAHRKLNEHFDSMLHPMPVGSKVKARKLLVVGGHFDTNHKYVPVRTFAHSQEDLEVVAHRGGQETGNPAEILVRNGKGEEEWIGRQHLRGKTTGKGRKLPDEIIDVRGQNENRLESMRKNKSLWEFLCAPSVDFSYVYETKDFGPALGLDLLFSGKPQFSEEDFSITFPFAASRGRDRVGDFLDVSGIDTSKHRKNPVAYLDHGKQPGEYSQPFGKCEDPHGNYSVKIYPEYGLAVATVFLDRDPENKVAQRVFSQFKAGILSKGSIGYRLLNNPRVLEADPDTGTPKGRLLDSVELLEVTLTGLPANGDM